MTPTRQRKPDPQNPLESVLHSLEQNRADFAKLTKELHEEQYYREKAKKEQRRFYKAVIGLFLAFVVLAYLALVGLSRLETTANLIRSCVNEPVTSYKGPETCYQKGQRQTGAAVGQIVSGFDADVTRRLQELLDAENAGAKTITTTPLPSTSQQSTARGPQGTQGAPGKQGKPGPAGPPGTPRQQPPTTTTTRPPCTTLPTPGNPCSPLQ